jgi:CRP-like cAMP-binding protein
VSPRDPESPKSGRSARASTVPPLDGRAPRPAGSAAEWQRGPIDDDERVALRVEHELFIRSFFDLRPPDRMVQQLSAGLRDVMFATGSEIYHQGDAAENLYFLIRGEVSLEAPGEEPWTFGPQSMLGVLDASAGRPHSRTAHVVREVSALTMTFRDYVDVMEDHFDYTKNSLELGCRTMHERSLLLAPDVFDLPARPAEPLVPLAVASGRAGGRDMLPLMDRVLVLRRCQVFGRTSVQALVTLAKHVEVERWMPGDVMFTPGDPAPHLRLVAAGAVRVTREEPAVSARFGPGELLLRQAVLGADVHAYRAEAETEAMTLRLLKEDLFDIAEDHFSLIGSLFAYLGRENERTRRLLAERTRAEAAPVVVDGGALPLA